MSRFLFSSLIAAFAGAAVWPGAGCYAPLAAPAGGSPGGAGDASADGPSSVPGPPLPPTAGPDSCVDPPAGGSLGAGGYAWKNVTILGGGFVSGIEFSPAPGGNDVIYARTDVGGAYRWDAATQRWVPITDWVGRDQANLTGIESIAPDPQDPNVVYVAAGQYLTAGTGSAQMLRSGDLGKTWTQNSIAAPMGGNVDGRNMGERLRVDPNLTSTLFFGSRNNGLWKSTDSAATWNPVTSFPVVGTTQYGLTFVFFDRRSGSPGTATSTIYVGVTTTAPATTSTPNLPMFTLSTAPSLFRSIDGGSTWQPVPGQPPNMFPHHAAMDSSGTLYFAFNSSWGPNSIAAGAIWKLDTSNDAWTQISPPANRGGFGGISVDRTHPGTVVVSSLDRWPDEIYRTTDGGAHWIALGANGSQSVRDVAGAQWLYWHGAQPNATGWMGDIEIDPNNPARVLYNTGQGIWWSDDITSADTGAPTHWTFREQGLEETVATGLVSPSSGAHLLSAVGDIAGFRHDDLEVSPAAGMFSNPIFSSTTGLDFAELHPAIVARVGTTGSGNSTQHGAYSFDGGTTWSPFASEPVGAAANGAGSIAVSADGAAMVWAPQSGRGAAVAPAYTLDRGKSWTGCTGLPAGARVAADRVNPNKFYATSGTRLYASTDGGKTFAPSAITLPRGGTVRPIFGIEGDLWIAAGGGLYHSIDSGANVSQIGAVQSAAALGFGRGATCQDYPVLYLAGQTNGVSGVYRSDDQGATWQRIDDPQHQFGSIGYVAGDPRSYGRVYLGSGGRGILYGDPQ
jgi:xyloglucan-specific exo-beta-1,4-glucanase